MGDALADLGKTAKRVYPLIKFVLLDSYLGFYS